MVQTMFFRPNDLEYNHGLMDLNACLSVNPPKQPECRFLTAEEHEIYWKTVNESEGFDTWQCPENIDILDLGIIRQLPVSKEELPDEYEGFKQDSQFALDQYNAQQGTNFQFVKVLKANCEFSGCVTYYLTFQAEDTTSGAFENFQARVHLYRTLEREVVFVRLEKKKIQSIEESGKGTSFVSISPSECELAYNSSTNVAMKKSGKETSVDSVSPSECDHANISSTNVEMNSRL